MKGESSVGVGEKLMRATHVPTANFRPAVCRPIRRAATPGERAPGPTTGNSSPTEETDALTTGKRGPTVWRGE
jgi:hypothetical protein